MDDLLRQKVQLPLPKELEVYDNICKILTDNNRDVLPVNPKDTLPIKFNPTKSYLSILFYDYGYLRVKYGAKTKFISLPSHLDYMLKACGVESYFKPEGDSRLRLDLQAIDDINNYSNLILEIYDYCYSKKNGDTFGCCSKYVECSNARKCLNESEKWSKGCAYRRNLINGRIFYGKNSIS